MCEWLGCAVIVGLTILWILGWVWLIWDMRARDRFLYDWYCGGRYDHREDSEA